MSRVPLFMAALAASLPVASLMLLGDADARACMEWEGGRYVGHDDAARPFSTTWVVFRGMVVRDLRDARGTPMLLLVCVLPFLPSAVAALVAPARAIHGVWLGLGLAVVVALLVLGDPGRHHDCDRKGSEMIFVVLLLGPVVGLICTTVGLMLANRSGRR